MRLIAALIIGLVLVNSPVAVAQDIHACDRMAANPPDPDRVTTGVERADVDIPAAIAACRSAVETDPDTARYSYQLGRVLFYDGQTEQAVASFNRAIDQDYRQAQFLLGLIMTRGYDDVSDDICRVEDLWRGAAGQNHANAQVSYVHFAIQGRFDGCARQATMAEMRAYLDQAESQLDYVGGLLIANLRRSLDNNVR